MENDGTKDTEQLPPELRVAREIIESRRLKPGHEQLLRELRAGARFSRGRDPDDARFDVITLRVPSALAFDPEMPLHAAPLAVALEAEAAVVRLHHFHLASVAGIAMGLGLHEVGRLMNLISAMITAGMYDVPKPESDNVDEVTP
jgi:hypothetical protein